MTEGLKEVKEGEEEEEDEDEGDFIDEYGNIKPVGIRTNRKVNYFQLCRYVQFTRFFVCLKKIGFYTSKTNQKDPEVLGLS